MVPVGHPADCSHSIITPMLNDAHSLSFSLMRTNTHTNRCAYVYVLVWSGGVFVDASVFIELEVCMWMSKQKCIALVLLVQSKQTPKVFGVSQRTCGEA